MSGTVLDEILARLGLVVLERLPDGVFLRMGSSEPAWFNDVMQATAKGRSVTVAEALPFLGQFLTEAEKFWREGGEGRGEDCLRSEPFVATGAAGGDVALAASAIVIGQQHFLIIELSAGFDERRRTLQTARENLLSHEAHVRRTGELLGPIGAAQKLAMELAGSGLTPAQRGLADELQAQLADVAQSIESLAPLPKGVSRAHRP